MLSVFEAAGDVPDAPALVDGDGAWTFRRLAEAVAARVQEWRVRPGQPVAFDAPPSRAAVVELMAIWAQWAIAAPRHPRWGESERDHLHREIDGLRADGLAAVVRTSGSSGAPRFAALSEAALRVAAWASAARLGWREGDRWLALLPFAHVSGLSIVVRCLLARRTIVLAHDLGEGLDARASTIASVVPAQLARLVQDRRRAPPSLRVLLVGGAACAPSLAKRARALGWPVRLTYGLTETCGQFATQREGDPDETVGSPLDGYEARVEGGALEVRSPSLFDGFVRRGRVEPAVNAEGWLRTGDLATIEGERLRILGRADETIVTGGEKVHPDEVEAVLAAALGSEVCIVGLDDPIWGQVVAAAVPGRSREETMRAIEACHRKLARHAVPRLVALVDALPVGPSGKHDRRAVARWPRHRWTRVQ